jgi:putative ABC transport system permease protein
MEQMFSERLIDVRKRSGRLGVAAFLARESWSVAVSALSQRALNTAQDARHTLRTLSRNPGFAVVAVATLALGIGANTAIFSAVNGVLLKPLPYEDAGTLIRVWEVAPQGWGMGFSPPDFVSVRQETTLLEDLAAFHPESFTLTGGEHPERVPAMKVTAGFFELLGLSLPRGRTFVAEEDLAGAEPVVIISHGVWQRRYGGDPNVIGETVTLDGVPRTIIGVAPAGLEFGTGRIDVWAPWGFDQRDMTLRGRHWLRVVGRLSPGVKFETATEELEAISSRLAAAYPQTNAGWGVMTTTLLAETVFGVRTPLLVLLGAVGFVLLIACANVANLLLARADTRSREMGVRAALGASRARLVWQMLTENMVLAVIGGVAGLILAYGALQLLLNLAGDRLPRAADVSIDVAVLLFTSAVTLAAGLLVGIVPAIKGSRRDTISVIKDGGHRLAAGNRGQRIRNALVIVEVALSLVLVVGAGLLVNSFWRLTRVDAGFSGDNVLTAAVSLPEARYETQSEWAAFFFDLVERLQRLPEVEAAAATHMLPLMGSHTTTVGLPERDDEQVEVERRHITPDYFRVMEIPLLAGRSLQATDDENAPDVTVVNEELARRVAPHESAVGKYIAWEGRTDSHTLEIVGIVGNVRSHGPSQDVHPTMYLQNAQLYPAQTMSLVIRTNGSPLDQVQTLRQEMRRLDSDLPPYQITTMDRLIDESVSSERFTVFMLTTFAALALLLGAVGIYGVMSCTVSQRFHELGVRVAMGADSSDVWRIVMQRGMLLTFSGLTLGIVGALAVTRVLSGMLFEVSATDPMTFLGVTAFIMVVALAACALPAKRATTVDPIRVLHDH